MFILGVLGDFFFLSCGAFLEWRGEYFVWDFSGTKRS